MAGSKREALISSQEIWQDVLGYVRENISILDFQTWFSNIKPLGVQNGELVLGVRNSFTQDWLRTHYLELLENALRSLGAQNPRVSFQILSAVQEPMLLPDSAPKPLLESTTAPEMKNRIEVERETVASNNPLSNHSSNLSSTISSSSTSGVAYSNPLNLNPKYVFDHFVVGPNNNMAHAASVAVADAPGRAYNPLFIYGDVGLGKTHLMHAVGHHALRQNPNLRVEYVSTETFTNELINAIREDRMTQFRNRYRSIDVLLVDDIQFLAGKERTQEEFFHTFNALHENHKQIILSSDRPPRDIQTLEARLRSRFEWGLITDIQSPDFETRVAILKMNAGNRKISIPQDVLEIIAKQVTTNIRELEGALIRVITYSSLNNVAFSRAVAARALSEVFSGNPISLEMNDILKAVAQHFSLSVETLKGSGRAREIALPRQVAMFLVREMTSHSLPEIGQFFGRDHTTVMHAIQKIGDQLKQSTELQQALGEIRIYLRGLE